MPRPARIGFGAGSRKGEAQQEDEGDEDGGEGDGQGEDGVGNAMRAVLGAVLLVAALHAVLAAPGLLVDEASTVPARRLEARR